MNRIAIIIPFFGTWPPWIELFFYSCTQNNEIDWLFFSDCEPPKSAQNIFFHQLSFDDYCLRASEKLKIKFRPTSAYKLCDLKVFYGALHRDQLKQYEFWGFGDIDVLWGDIRAFYTDNLLNQYDVFSTHADRLSGHLAIFKNNQYYTYACFNIENWKYKLERNEIIGLDEIDLSTYLYPQSKYIRKFYGKIVQPIFGWRNAWVLYYKIMPFVNWFFQIKKHKLYFKEQHTTPILSNDGFTSEHDASTWYFKDRNISNDRTPNQYIYLHFMLYKKNRFRPYYYWKDKFYNIPICYNFSDGIKLNKNGIFPLEL